MKLMKSVFLMGAIGMIAACSNDFGVSEIITDAKARVSEEEKPDWIVKEGAVPGADHTAERWTDPDTNCMYARQYVEGATVWTMLGVGQDQECPRHFVLPYLEDESDWDLFREKLESLKAQQSSDTPNDQSEVSEQNGR